MFKYDLCRCCGEEELTPFITLPDSPVANALFEQPDHSKYPLSLNYCSMCGHLQLDSAPDPDVIFSSYRYKSGVSNSFRKHFSEYAEFAYKKFGLSSDSHVLEIGSNDAYLLSQFKNLGCNVQGVEPSQFLASYYRELNIPLVQDFFSTRLVSVYDWEGKFNLICANNVLAHIPDSAEVIDGISMALNDRGVLIVECGHRDAILSGSHLDNVYHEHIDYYSPYSFARLIERFGLRVEHSEEINSHGLSFRIYARKTSKSHNAKFKKINVEDKRQEVQAKIKKRKDTMRGIIGNRLFVAYGAAAKAVTSLYMLDLVSDQLQGVYDDNELKQGFYFPGTNIKIEPASTIPLDALVIVTAWNFFDEIKEKLLARGHKGEIVCMQ